MSKMQDFELKARMMHARGFSITETRSALCGKVGKMKDKTAAEFKREVCNRKAKAKAERKFSVILAGGHKVSKKMSDTWDKRISNNVSGFYDPRKAKGTV